MICAIKGSLFLYEHLSDSGEKFLFRIKNRDLREIDPISLSHLYIKEPFLKRRRHMSCKCRENRRHAERALHLQDLLLKLLMVIHKTLRKGAAPSVKISHPEPVEICRTAEETRKIFIGETKLLIDSLPHRILSCKGERHIDSVKRHEIDLFLPAVEIPPTHGIVECTVIQIISVLIRRRTENPFRRKRKHFRKDILLAAP